MTQKIRKTWVIVWGIFQPWQSTYKPHGIRSERQSSESGLQIILPSFRITWQQVYLEGKCSIQPWKQVQDDSLFQSQLLYSFCNKKTLTFHLRWWPCITLCWENLRKINAFRIPSTNLPPTCISSCTISFFLMTKNEVSLLILRPAFSYMFRLPSSCPCLLLWR